jgi:hypothetical protein
VSQVRFAALAAALVLTAAIATAQDKKKIDNPEYANWAKFKPGTSTKLKMTNEFNGMKSGSTITTKLVEVKDDKLVLEMQTETEVMGQKFNAPAQKRDVTKTLELDAKAADAAKAGKPEGTTEEGSETLKVGGTEVKAKWYKYKTKAPMGEVSGQMWMSEDVPGTLVKMTTTADKFSMTMELVEFTKK